MNYPKTSYKILKAIFLIVALATHSFLLAQRFEIDSNEFFNSGKSGIGSGSLASNTTINDPSSVNVYGLTWDTLNIRVNRNENSEKYDTSFIRLTGTDRSSFVFPYKGKLLSPFGYRGRHFHAGVDIKLNHGDTVVCAFDGKVRMAKYYHGYGNTVVVRHSNGLETLYGHLSKINVKVNQEIKAGELVGLGGRTGRASCDHLHFETRYLGEPFNPKQFIDLDNYALYKDILLITNRTFGRAKDYLPKGSDTLSGSESLESEPTVQVAKSSGYKSKYSTSSKRKKYHSVRNGDTLYSIANRNNTTVKNLCSINRIKANRTLKIGTKLRVK
jgi:murein DD-endopeptidase MepM/ murein hydrolase activator NlpD